MCADSRSNVGAGERSCALAAGRFGCFSATCRLPPEGTNGCSSSWPGWTMPYLDSGTSFQAPSRSRIGSRRRGATRRSPRRGSHAPGYSSRSVATFVREEERARLPLARVAERPETLPSVVATVIWIGCSIPCSRPTPRSGRPRARPPPAGRPPARRSARGRRTPPSPSSPRFGLQRRVDGEQGLVLRRGTRDHAVVHPQPASVPERMAVRPLDREPVDARMCAKTRPGHDVAGQLAQVRGRSRPVRCS